MERWDINGLWTANLIYWKKHSDDNNISRPIVPPMYRSSELLQWFGKIRLSAEPEPTIGLEPITSCLQGRCSSNWVTLACAVYTLCERKRPGQKHRVSFFFSQGSDRKCYLLSGSYPDARRIRDSNPGTVSRLSAFKTDPFNRLGNPAYYFTICQPCVKLTGKYNHPKTDPKDFVKLSSFSFVPSSLFKLNFEF